ncbi:MAG: ferrous iron transport protein B [Oscillospiraceae bacterium]|nr:ferrous iron transport protein B [Oscillospiraceae bacterium]
MKEIAVGFIGNPNCGKTTLFNAYTGAKLKVANWPGVTVEKKEGALKYHDVDFKLVDLPGIYSLTSYTMEEKLSRQYILDDEVDVIVDVVDASCLERNLFLTLQLIELGKPVVLALNMMDIVEERGMEIDMHRLPEMLGIPVIPVCAKKKRGLDVLIHAVAHHCNLNDTEITPKIHHHPKKEVNRSTHIHDHHGEHTVVYSDEIEDYIDVLSNELIKKYPCVHNVRWNALKLIEKDSEILEKYNKVELPEKIRTQEFDKRIINEKYDFIDEIVDETLVNKNSKSERTEKLDSLLTHRILGLPIFLAIMAVVFFLTFSVGNVLVSLFDFGIEKFSSLISSLLVNINADDVVTSLIMDGIIPGVGGILTFLPNIFILFLALAFLEDSGYMSRVAYIMDGIMSRMGLSGRAFIPMLLGFGCSVPAVMAARALENPKDKLKTILVTPFMSCSARLPIYVLFSQIFFKENAMLVSFSMYVISIFVAITIAVILGKVDKRKSANSLLIELPEYKSPNAGSIMIYVWEKVKDYLSKAGTTIFIASIVLWFIMNFGASGMTSDPSSSFAASVGKFIVPVLAPIGLGYWRIGVSLISGIAAKELVVSGCGVLYSVANINSQDGHAVFGDLLRAEGFTSLNAFCLMVFSLLYIPCIATIATIKNETKSVKWMFASIGLQLMTAWIVCFVIYQAGSLIF